MENCIFCKIASGIIPSDKVYEDDRILCFKDLHPQAPIHILVISKKHFAKLTDIDSSNSAEIAYIFEKIPVIAKKVGLENGFRVIANCGEDAGQTVFHVHFHILGGKKFSESF